MADVVSTNPPTMAPPGGHYSHAVSANGFVFVSGELPIAPDGTKLDKAPFEQQAQQVLDNIAFRTNGAWKTDFPNAKVLVAQLKTDDAWRISSGGGGGYGSPFERPAEDVSEDVRQGYVSVKAAAERYGVVVDAETFAVDQAATDKLRAAKG